MERFWAKVKRSDRCWEWTAFRDKLGRGRININRKPCLAHRVAWELENGEIPEGQVVCHKCDNPACVRIDHLFLGTQADNLRDMREKKRHNIGEKNGQAKLTSDQVLEIKQLLKFLPRKDIARMFEVSTQAITDIALGRR